MAPQAPLLKEENEVAGTKMAFRSACAALAVTAVAALAACGSVHDPAAGTPASVALVSEGSPSGPLTDNFNPWQQTSALSILDATAMIYEPLYQFDLAQPGTNYPWLATSYTWANGGKQLSFTLRSGVNWSNGTPFTSADAAFTFNLLKNDPAVNLNAIPLTGVSAPDPRTVVLTFSSPQYADFYFIATTYMVPESLWRRVSTPGTYANPKPVGTGPFLLSSFSPKEFDLKANPSYWQHGLPKITELRYPAYDTNDSANFALAQGTLQWAGNFIAGMSQIYVAKDPAHNKYWFPPQNTVSLIPNLKSGPTADLAVRQAISDAISRTTISQDGEAGVEPPATSATGLVLPLLQQYLAPSASQYTLSPDADVAAARAVLEADGYVRDRNGIFAKNGRELSVTLVDPSSFSDYAGDCQIIASELRAAGISASFRGLSVSEWTNDVATGNFQLTIHWSNAAFTPYNLYSGWLNSAASAPIGKPATGDYERFADASIDSGLAAFAATNSLSDQLQALAPIEQAVATQLPVIPLVYGVSFGEYVTTHFSGWPSPSDPYEVAAPTPPNNEVVVLHLAPVP
jgi:peptide/nickel transport system substrate-binding protein